MPLAVMPSSLVTAMRGLWLDVPCCGGGVRASASRNHAQYLRTEGTEARSSGLWAPRMVGPKLTMSESRVAAAEDAALQTGVAGQHQRARGRGARW